jgi:membrane protein DedA with SNARE-associated domain
MLFAPDTLAEITSWIAQNGYWVVFACLALEGVLFTSMLVPGLLVLIAGGFYAGQGHLDPLRLVGAAVAGVWLGDAASYCLGRLLWSRLLAGSRFGKAMARVRPVLETRGAVFLVLYHFEPIARMVGAAAAGSMALPVRRWLPFDYLGGVLWVLFYGTAGFLLARAGLQPGEWERLRPLTAVVTCVLLAWLWVINRAIRRSLALPPGPAAPATGAELEAPVPK